MANVAILVPSYNHGQFLATCLDSVLGQTYSDWNLVIVDDGSKDSSIEIAVEYAAKDDRILFSQNASNLGTYGTLDRALCLCESKYVAVLNSDDCWEPEKLTRQISLLDQHPELPFCTCLGQKIDGAGLVLQEEGVHSDWPTSEIQNLLPWLIKENRVLASSVVFRRDTLKFNKMMRYSGDWMALLRLATRPVGFIPEFLTNWRIHGSNTFQLSPNQVAEEIRMREVILDSRKELLRMGLASHDLHKSFVLCAMDLLALYLLAGDIQKARALARTYLTNWPLPPAAIKRFSAVLLPLNTLQQKLWGSKVADFESFNRANANSHYESLQELAIDWA